MKVQAFLFPNLFYIQPNKIGAVKEGAVRFELIQTMYTQELRPCKNLIINLSNFLPTF